MAALRRWVTETLLWLAAALGVLCMALVVLAYTCQLSLILFRTGSMEPTIAAGDVAVVRQIEASEVRRGDILTVERPGELPVTHRVIDIDPGSHPGERVIRMQGDANTAEDPYPYTITDARRTLFSVPGLATPIHQMSNPYVLGSATLAATALVLWAFWPRTPSAPAPAPTARRRRRPSRSTHLPLAVHVSLVLAGAAVLTVAVPAPVHAAPVHAASGAEDLITEEHTSTYLTVTSVYSPGAGQNLSPGQGAVWELNISSHAPTDGVLESFISAEGEVPLLVTAATCTTPWATPPGRLRGTPAQAIADCPGTRQVLTTDAAIPHAGPRAPLGRSSLSPALWHRVVITVADTASREHQGTEAAVTLGLHAFEDELIITPPEAPEQPGSPGPAEPSAPPQDPVVPSQSAAPTQSATSTQSTEPLDPSEPTLGGAAPTSSSRPSPAPSVQAGPTGPEQELGATGGVHLLVALGAGLLLAGGAHLYRAAQRRPRGKRAASARSRT